MSGIAGWALTSLVLVGLTGGYLGVLHHRRAGLPSWPQWRTVAWSTGAVLVAVALAPVPLHPDHHRAHMAQHLLLGMYAPLGLVLGAPVTLLLGSVPRRGQLLLTRVLRSRPVRVVAHPVTAAVLNVGAMFVLYLTPVYHLAMHRPWVHGLLLVHFLLAGYLYTWAIAGPDPAPHRPGLPTRVGVLVLAAGTHAYLGKLLYARAGELVGSDQAGDLEAAAQWMYYGGDGAELVLAVLLFAGWYRRADRRPAPVLGTASA